MNEIGSGVSSDSGDSDSDLEEETSAGRGHDKVKEAFKFRYVV